MAEKPILFSTAMVKAILDGHKTQTRRVMKPQPRAAGNGIWEYRGEIYLSDEALKDYLFHEVYGVKGSPYGSVYSDGTSDTLWVRETWATIKLYDHLKPSEIPKGDARWPMVWYNSHPESSASIHLSGSKFMGKTRPSIFMPRWASRLTLQLTDVRIDRVKNISYNHIDAEGTPPKPGQMCYRNDYYQRLKDFRYLWDSINLKRGYGWQTNPWVWVVEFSVKESQKCTEN